MSELDQRPSYATYPLTRGLAVEHAAQLALLASQIPQVEYSANDILADQKGERNLHNKWDHSLVVIDGNKPAAFVMGYEREAENNLQYPNNTLYVSELAVAKTHQEKGLARWLLGQFFGHNNKAGFKTLEGELNYSIQTNAAESNAHVVKLYKSFGFTERSEKEYPNRTDVVLGAKTNELRLQ
jgi:ribosomal protein S18 acetylase RimI-like enzyme